MLDRATAVHLTWSRFRWWWVLAAVLVLGTGGVLSWGLARQTQELMSTINAVPDTPITARDRADLVRNAFQYQADNLIKLWTVIAAALVGLVGWLNFRVAQQNLEQTKLKIAKDQEASDANRKVAQEAQITNRFTQAIGQLGAMKDKEPNLEVRLGGIYALEQIAMDEPQKYYWTILEVLTAYLRLQPKRVVTSGQHPRAGEDIQAILYVLARRRDCFGHGLEKRNEKGPDICWDKPDSETENERVLRLQRTYLRSALIRDAHLEQARLRGADLSEARLERSKLMGAKLRGANLFRADMEDTDLRKADLRNVNLGYADLRRACLDGAVLDNADLSTAIGVTTQQVAAASRKGTRLPPHLVDLQEPAEPPTGSAPPPSFVSPAS